MHPETHAFPHDKMDAALRYLRTVKPYWARFSSRLVVVPTYVDPEPDQEYGAIMSTDQGMRLFVDVLFVRASSVQVIAGAIEYQMLYHVKNFWKRMRWLPEEEWDRWANVCMGMEIVSTMEASNEALNMEAIHVACSKSVVFTKGDLSRWFVDGPPSVLSAGAWDPIEVGLDRGLSAEQYLHTLRNDDPKPSDESDSDSEDQGESSSEDESTSQQPEPDEEGLEDPDPDPQSDEGDQPQGDQKPPSEPDSSHAESEEADGVNGTSEDAGESEDPSDDDEIPSDPESESQDEDERASGQDSRPSAQTEEKMSDPRSQMWANQVANPDDELSKIDSHEFDEDESPGKDQGEIERAFIDLEEDIDDYGAHGISDVSSLIEWRRERRKDRKVSWDSQLSRLVNSHHQQIRTAGASDLSYSIRNPNQQMMGPVLQGMHDYAPTIQVIGDVSASMLREGRMKRNMDAFSSLLQRVLLRFSSPVTWITVSGSVQDVGKTMTWNADAETRWSRGFGGTHIGPTIEECMKGTFRWEGRRLPKPDMLIVGTDCGFQWPSTRPSRDVKLIVVNVAQEDEARKYLPEWLDIQKELITVE